MADEEELRDYLVYEHTDPSSGSSQLFMKLGAEHEPFRMRRQVAGRVVMKNMRAFQDTNDLLVLLSPFVVTEDRDRLEAALDDEDRPISMPGILKVNRQCQERYLRAPLGDS